MTTIAQSTNRVYSTGMIGQSAGHGKGPRPRRCIPARGAALAAVRAETYIEFLLGHGEAPGIDLGSPVLFTREDTVYSQRFTRGLTLANVGDEPREVTLERPYYDLTGALRTSVILAARSAEVLRRDPA